MQDERKKHRHPVFMSVNATSWQTTISDLIRGMCPLLQ